MKLINYSEFAKPSNIPSQFHRNLKSYFCIFSLSKSQNVVLVEKKHYITIPSNVPDWIPLDFLPPEHIQPKETLPPSSSLTKNSVKDVQDWQAIRLSVQSEGSL